VDETNGQLNAVVDDMRDNDEASQLWSKAGPL